MHILTRALLSTKPSVRCKSLATYTFQSRLHAEKAVKAWEQGYRFQRTVGGIKTVTFPSSPIPFRQKRMPVRFNRRTGIEWEAEQVTNGATDHTYRS